MTEALKARIAEMQGRIKGRCPVAEVSADTQLFVSSDAVCRRLMDIAVPAPSDNFLEPSAGTGAILRAVQTAAPGIHCEAVERHIELARQLEKSFPAVSVHCLDFLSFAPQTRYSLIVMNPPFRNGADIHHIRHARDLLAPGGRLIAVCTDGPRQQRHLLPEATCSEKLPRGSFAYTGVATMILRIDAPASGA